MVLLVAAVLCVGLAACGAQERQVAPVCLQGPAVVERALARAPGAVALPGGTAVSSCVEDADTDAELQNMGRVLTAAAEHLAARAEAGDAVSALRLGYLAGAVRRGAAHTNGVAAQLQRRIEITGADIAGGRDLAARRALERGLVAGAASG